MRPPAKIQPYLPIEKMFKWLQDAPNEAAYKRRMAVWLTHTGKLHAPKVAQILAVSTPAVTVWIRQYNLLGPEGLQRKGRGGRRRAFMTIQKEAQILAPFIKMAKSGNIPKTPEIKQAIEKTLNKKVSLPYVYRLLGRHGWNEIIAQSRRETSKISVSDDFQKLARPWLRNS
jgi:transposase